MLIKNRPRLCGVSRKQNNFGSRLLLLRIWSRTHGHTLSNNIRSLTHLVNRTFNVTVLSLLTPVVQLLRP
jgi:hypothetical protein